MKHFKWLLISGPSKLAVLYPRLLEIKLVHRGFRWLTVRYNAGRLSQAEILRRWESI